MTDPSASLDFSRDSVIFDTVFTSLGSTTKLLTIYNTNSRALKITSVRLAGGSASPFRLNLDGIPGRSFNDIEIPANDSLFMFIEVTIDPNNTLAPFLIQDSVVFTTNGNIQDIDLVAYGQNARFIVANKAIQTAGGFLPYALLDTNLNATINWDNSLPYVIWGGYAVIDSTQTLNIQAGTKIYFANSSGLWVYRYGPLKVNGTLQDPVIFQGIRRESYYQNIPGQWDRIWINEGSTGNEINHAVIQNGFIGIQAESLFDTLPSKKLKISNTIIQNMSGFSLFTRYFDVEVRNSVLARAGQYAVALTRGGGYKFLHTTIANFWNAGSRTTPSLYINDYGVNASGTVLSFPLYKAEFDNCILWGGIEEELELDFAFGTTSHIFRNSIMRTKLNVNSPNFISVLKNQNPLFKNIQDNNYELTAGSPARDIGNPLFLDPETFSDIKGVDRTTSPDAGAYEFQ